MQGLSLFNLKSASEGSSETFTKRGSSPIKSFGPHSSTGPLGGIVDDVDDDAVSVKNAFGRRPWHENLVILANVTADYVLVGFRIRIQIKRMEQ
jgi:hypothetical protein